MPDDFMQDNPSVLLVHPPVSKPCEPPAGIARLTATLCRAGLDCRMIDAGLEGMLYLLERPSPATDTWTRRAVAGAGRHLQAIRSKFLYADMDKYRRAVHDINRVLSMAGRAAGIHISLSNYKHETLSPLRSRDLSAAAERFAENPFYPYFRQRFDALAQDWSPGIVGFSVNYLSQALCAAAMAAAVRRIFPASRIIFGGGLITSWMALPGFVNPLSGLVDAMVVGPGEEPLLAFCNRSLVSESEKEYGFDYNGFPLDDYLSPGRILPYAASRGCYWRKCRFCPETAEQGGFRPTPAAIVAKELTGLSARTQPRLIHFVDNALSPRFMGYLAENPPGPPWYGFARITPHLADMDFVRGLKASGCVMLKLGIESGDQAVLDALEKGTDLKMVSSALRMLKAVGIAVYAYLLFGTPAENLKSARKTLDFVAAHADCIDFLNPAIFNLPVGSPECVHLNTSEFYPGDLSLYREFEHPRGWNRDRVRRFLTEEFFRHDAIRPVINRDPPYFTSNHAPFFSGL
jgi:radical SAM superfamily enzyme YgiQ (UPF0313 family)